MCKLNSIKLEKVSYGVHIVKWPQCCGPFCLFVFFFQLKCTYVGLLLVMNILEFILVVIHTDAGIVVGNAAAFEFGVSVCVIFFVSGKCI